MAKKREAQIMQLMFMLKSQGMDIPEAMKE
jgi:hypothetical protein